MKSRKGLAIGKISILAFTRARLAVRYVRPDYKSRTYGKPGTEAPIFTFFTNIKCLQHKSYR